MAQVNAGRVRFVSRGEYNNSTQYYVFDLVTYEGSSYFAKENTIGNLPTDTTKWQLIAEKGDTGNIGPTGNGIASITKTGTSGPNVDIYTITFTDGTTTTFEVTNGEVTQEQLDEVQNQVDYYKTILNALPKVNGTGTSITLDNTAEAPMELKLNPNLEQTTTTGKNLFDKNNANIINKYINTTTLALGNGTNGRYTLYINAQPNTTYTVSKIASTYYRVASSILSPSSDNISLTNAIANDTGTDITLTTGENDNYLLVTYIRNDTTYTEQEILNSIQIELGDSATSYEPYTNGPSPNPSYPQDIHVITGDNTITISNSDNTKSQTFPLTLGNLEYCKIGDYADDFIKATNEVELTSGKWYLKKNVGKVIFDGSESWAVQNSGTSNFFYRHRYIENYHYLGTNDNWFCNNFIGGSISSTTTVSGMFISGSGETRIRFGTEMTDTQFKTWLSTHNTTIYYQLETPEYILLNDTLQTQLENIYNYALGYKDQTNISQVNADLPFIIDASAVRDMSNIYEL